MLYFTGDTHMPINIHKLSTKCFPDAKIMTKNDYVIICGDFGGVWNNSPEELYWRKWLDNKPFTTLFIDGNHENHPMLQTFPEIEFCGGRAHQISKSVIHLMRGQVFTIDNTTIFTMGGASSTDKESRKEGVSWWSEELPNQAEMDEGLKNLAKHNNQVDLIVTHTAPIQFQTMLQQYFPHQQDSLEIYLDYIYRNVSFKYWYFGHFHQERKLTDGTCLYNIVERYR